MQGRSGQLERCELRVRGRRVVHHAAGAGEPLVLVHGLAGSARWWRPIVPALARRRRLLLIDLPGFGGMRGAARYLRSRDAAAWLADWAAAAGLESADFGGHSMGAMVALRLAARRPELVRRLALVAPAGMPSERSPLGYVLPVLRATLAYSPDFLLVLGRDLLRAGPLTLLDAARGVLAADVRADLERLRAPLLLIWGEDDRIVPPALAELFQAAAPQAALVTIPGAGHVPMYTRPGELAAALSAFLDQGSPASAASSDASAASRRGAL